MVGLLCWGGEGLLRVATPVLRSRLGAPAVQRFERVRARVEAQAREFVEVGRMEEVRSRALAQQTVRKVVDGILDRIEDTDHRVERFLRSLFRDPAPPRTASPPQQEGSPSPPVFPTRPVPAHQ
jgi:hypothetical protein